MLGGDHIKKQSNRGGKIDTLNKFGDFFFFFEDTLKTMKSLTTLMEQVLPLL